MASELSNGIGLGALTFLAFLMTYAVHSTVVVTVVWLAVRTRAVRTASTEDILWKAALVGPVLTALLQTGLGVRPLGGGWHLAPSVAAAPEPAGPATLASFETLRLVPATDVPRPRPAAQRTERLHRLHRVAAEPRAASAAASFAIERPALSGRAATAAPWSPAPTWTSALAPAALGAWALLAAFGLARVARRHARLRRVLGRREPVAEGPALVLLGRLCAAAGRRADVRLTRCDRLPSPIALGRNEICIPPRALHELDARQQEAMLAHELAHLVRRDPAWLTACSVLEALFFFQPLGALARRRMQANAEFLCDDWAAGRSGAGVLARCLAQVAGWIETERPPLPAPGMARRDSTLVRRVRRLADGSSGPRAARRASVVLGTLALLAAVSCGVPGVVAQHADTGFLRRVSELVKRWIQPREERVVLAVHELRPEQQSALERSLAAFRSPASGGEEPAVVHLPDGRIGEGERLQPGRFHLVDERGRTVLVLEVGGDDPDLGRERVAERELRRAERELERAARAGRGDASSREREARERLREAEWRGQQADPRRRRTTDRQRAAEERARQREQEHARALEQVSSELEQLSAEYARAADQLARERDRTMSSRSRGLQQAYEQATREYQRAIESWQQEHERRGQSIETEWQRALEQAERARAELQERAAGDDSAYERMLEQWEQAQEARQEEYEVALDAWSERSDEEYAELEERYAAFEERYAELEQGYEEGDETYEQQFEELEARYEDRYDELSERYDELFDQEWRDCDHGCSERCRYGCTHPDDEDALEDEEDEADDEFEIEEVEEPATRELFVRADAGR